MKRAKGKVMSNIIWYLKQLLPLRYVSTYGRDGHRWIEIWRMWFGVCFSMKKHQLADEGDVDHIIVNHDKDAPLHPVIRLEMTRHPNSEILQ